MTATGIALRTAASRRRWIFLPFIAARVYRPQYHGQAVGGRASILLRSPYCDLTRRKEYS